MHFTNAFLEEAYRYNNVLYAGVPRQLLSDIKCNGYRIPAKTNLIVNMYKIMNDPDVFENPREFRPERFLDKEGNFCHHEHVTPYGIGKRFCMAQSLAEKEILLFLVCLLQTYEFRGYPGEKLPSYKLEDYSPNGVVGGPPKFLVQISSRG